MKTAIALMMTYAAWGQTALLPAKDAVAASLRMVQLMESVSIVVPDLPRAGGPLLEQARAAQSQLERSPASTIATWTFLERVRKYAALLEAMPRPYPFPETGQKQIAELRDIQTKLEAHFAALLVDRENALRPADRDNLRRYADANQTLPAPSANQPRVVFLGDSITDTWRLQEYFPGKDYINRGISGQVTSEMLARMKADVLDLKPRAVVILAGTNDIARGTPLPYIQNNLTMICDLADHAKVKVILASVLPVHDYNSNVNASFLRTVQRPPATILNLNAWMRTFAQNRGYTFVNYFDAVKDGGGMLRKDFAEDGLHPNAAGYRVMAPIVDDAITRTVGPTAAPARKK